MLRPVIIETCPLPGGGFERSRLSPPTRWAFVVLGNTVILTRKKSIGHDERLDRLTAACADVWCDTVRRFWRTYNNHGVWLSKYQMHKWMCTRTINTAKKSNAFEHKDMKAFAGKRPNPEARSKDKTFLAQNTAQSVVGAFYDAIESWGKNDNEGSNPPHKMKGHFKASWNYTQIKLRNGYLELQTPRGKDPIKVAWHHPKPRRVEVGWRGDWEEGIEYELRAQYKVDPDRSPVGDKTIGIDLGEKHLVTATDGEKTWLVNGAEIRSLRRYQNKIKATLNSKIDTKEPGSRRFKRLVISKNKQLASLRNQIKDVLHKLSRRLVETLFKAGASTLVFGDVKNIRQGLDYGGKQNQRLHQWVHGKFRKMITYKARLAGMEVNLIPEQYTTQTCPCCGHRHKPKGRNYQCPSCKVVFHRDEVGARNIRQKYLDGDGWQDGYLSSPVVADEGSTATSERSCSSPRGGKTNQVSLFASEASAAPSQTRETCNARITKHPVGIRFRPHMDCGPRGSPDIVSQG